MISKLVIQSGLASLHGVLAQSSEGLSATQWMGMLGVFVALLFVIFAALFVGRYRRCPSNKILVIYGKAGHGAAARCIHGGAAFIMPLVQDYAYLSLEPIQIEIPLKGALSIENIRVNVPSVFTIAIGTEPELMQNAAIRLLGLDMAKLQGRVEHIIFGQLREVVASMRIEDIARHREQFLKNIQASLEPELRKLGLVLLNVNITDIDDESGYIVAVGKKAAAQAVQQALVDVAGQERMGAIGVADADREKTIQVAQARQLREIGLRDAAREQAVKVAELDRDQKIGEQTALRDQAVRLAELEKERKIAEQAAGFERDSKVKESEQAMRVAIAEANAKAIAGESKAQADVAAAQAQLQVKQAEAFQIGETRKREAEAAVQEAQNRAMAKAALAEAERVEAERRAALEAPAKAEKAKMVVDAQAQAEKRRVEAEGEAAAIFVKLEAEARGQYEILAKKGEGLKQIIEACGSADKAYQLLMLEHIDKLVETSASAIANIKFDKIVVWEGGHANGNGTSNTAAFLQNMTRMMPPMMQVMKDIGGVELPGFVGKVVGEAKEDPVASAAGPAIETTAVDQRRKKDGAA
ncbi:MAG TPA: SPFH domain-containing protein [Phycisphaerae bacterium]|nr:SPFH domain-containing protein [Phycisphaerae bacterium]